VLHFALELRPDQPDPIPGPERLSVDDALVVAQQDISALRFCLG
jgi:hypothetical protein